MFSVCVRLNFKIWAKHCTCNLRIVIKRLKNVVSFSTTQDEFISLNYSKSSNLCGHPANNCYKIIKKLRASD